MLGRLSRLLCLSRLSGNPFERPRGDESDDQEVLSTEAP
jgi:hypothetical protein